MTGIRSFIFVLILAIVVVVTSEARAERSVVYVDSSATGLNNGESWENAYISLQDALLSVSANVTILLAGGTYKPDQGIGVVLGDREATFQFRSEVTIAGGYGGLNTPHDPNIRDTNLYETILSGDLLDNDEDVNTPAEFLEDPTRSDNSYHVVRCEGAASGVVIDGLIITAGCAAGPTGDSSAYYGGGLLSSQSTITLTSVTVHNCSAQGDYAWGGGIYATGNITMTNCLIENNIAYGSQSGSGGGMYCYGEADLDGCVFTSNIARSGGGLDSGATINLIDCRFVANAAILLAPDTSGVDNSGGGMYASGGWAGSSLTRCLFLGNIATSGGGLRTSEAEPVITNCLFAGNSAIEHGGGMRCDTFPCDIELINCTFADNTAGEYGGGLYASYEAEPHLRNCILWGNSAAAGPQIATRGDSLVMIDYTDLQGGREATASADEPGDEAYIDWGQGNINADPCFADPGSRDYHLQSQAGRYWLEHGVWVLDDQTSPCIDAGYPYTDPSAEPIPNGARVNLGTYGGTMQASRSNKPALVGDLNGDGIVDFRDMALMGSNWLLREFTWPPIDD